MTTLWTGTLGEYSATVIRTSEVQSEITIIKGDEVIVQETTRLTNGKLSGISPEDVQSWEQMLLATANA